MPANDGKTYWVYITAGKPHGVLYVGMTSDLAGRAWEHRERVMDGFTKRYWVGGSSTSKRTMMRPSPRSASAR